MTNTVRAWGLNSYGQTNLPAGLGKVAAVAAGHDHSLALLTNGTVTGWGDNTYHQISPPAGLSNVTALAAGGFHSAVLRADGTVVCWGYNQYGQTDTPPGLTNVTAIACGNSFTLALRNDGQVIAWGDNFYGQTDVPSTLSNVVAIAAGGVHGLAITSDGAVSGWGDNTFDQLNFPADLTNAVMIAGGFTHSLALTADGRIVAWGDNDSGQCTVPPGLSRVIGLSAGYAHSAVVVDELPLIITQPRSVTTNQGAKVTFSISASGAMGYTWWRNTGLTNAVGSSSNSMTINSVTSTNAGSYWVVIYNLAGSVTSSVATLTVLTPPTIVVQPLAAVTNAGDTAVFSVQANGSAPLGYRWQFNNMDLGVPSTNTLVLPGLRTNDVGSYRVIVTNSVGAATSQVASLIVVGIPTIVTQPVSRIVVQGGSNTFKVSLVAAPPVAYQWYYSFPGFGAYPIPDATNDSYAITNADVSMRGDYFVVVTNTYGTATSMLATLTVVIPPQIVTPPRSIVTNIGARVEFSVDVNGSTPLGYRWRKIAGVTNSTLSLSNLLVFSNVSTNNSGSYFVVISNVADSVTSSVFTLTVTPKPNIYQQPVSVSTNEGATVVFSVGVTATGTVSYQWQKNGTNQVGAASDTLVLNGVSISDAGSYRVMVANESGSVTSLVAVLTISGPPLITMQPTNRSVVVGTNVTFAVTATAAGPIAYQWRRLTTNGWEDLADATGPSLVISNVQSSDAGSYAVLATNSYGAVTSSVAMLTVLVPPQFLSQPQDISVAIGGTAVFSATASGSPVLAYRWYHFIASSIVSVGTASNKLVVVAEKAVDVGTYFVVVSNSVGSVTSSMATLTFLLRPQILLQPRNVTTNLGATAVFSVTATNGDGGLGYQWMFNNTNCVANGTNATLVIAPVTGADVGSYRAIVTNNIGSSTSAPATLTIYDPSLTPAQLFALNHPGSNGFFLTIAFEVGRNYRIQASTNLQDWTDLTNFINASASMQFMDNTVTNDPQRFYRVISP